jgi:hypothetical protein
MVKAAAEATVVRQEGITDMGQLAAIVPLIAAAASAAGAGLQISSANTETKNMNNAVAQQLAQQQEYGKRAQAQVQPNIQKSAAPSAQAQIQQGAADQLAKYSQLQQQPQTTAPSATPTNRVVSASGGAATNAGNQAAAKLAGYGTWENAQNINNQNVANQLGVINSESAAAGQVLPSVLSQAQGSAAQTAGIGSLLGSAGGIAGTYAAQQPFSSALQQYLNSAQYGQMYGGNQPGWQNQPAGTGTTTVPG